MATVGIELPHVGESVTEAVIGKWLKQPGETVEKFDALVEVVTDKVSMEFPAPHTGTLVSIVAEEGDTVPMGAVIAQMEVECVVEIAAPDTPTDEPAPNRVGTLIQGANVGPTGGTFRDTALEDQQAKQVVSTSPVATPAPQQSHGNRSYSPVVSRLAAANGVDLAIVTGTGRGGRVTKQDVQAVIDAGPAAAASPTPAATQDGPVDEDRMIQPSPIRRMIASHMVRSTTEIPHAWSTVEVDMTGLMACRTAQRQLFRERHGVDLTFLAFTGYAVSAALRDNPLINSSWEDGSIRLKGRVNLGLAVAAPDGLVVPVIHDSDREGITGLARKIAPLVERARSGSLALDDVQGGTFTLNNTGTLGSILGGAIINHPQAAIVTTEAIVKRPVVLSGPGGDAIAIRSMMNICLSFDHRIIDGAEASEFLQIFKRNLEAWSADSELN
ncbi:MAG: 2-oxo acid dehydrogenase subunit E2 [Chloroflexi bacterium]|nr:2-oxo acid dehydrogenase subunit E2 [Chloroflexota bacterium]MBT4515559.1 2-oxo acid dehydrogenase subunit E2 [Chloroflexota bacterium]